MSTQSNINSSGCKICGAPTFRLHYGVIACDPCKMFFKRNAENREKILKCRFDGQCKININNRHTCSACRLKKCFSVGMCVQRLRCSQLKKAEATSSSEIVEVNNRKNLRIPKLATLNLLIRDQSLLTTDQWILLSNMIHSYDEHHALVSAKSYATEINRLHPKLRFKVDAKKTKDIITVICQATEPFIRSNRHFASLPIHDRSLVLHGAVDNVSCLGSAFILRQSELMASSAFRHGMETIYGSVPYHSSLNIIASLDQDVDLIKLSLSIFAFCTSSCTLYNENVPIGYLTDIPSFLNIQNLYAEVVWKYLLYKYKFEESVVRFTHLINSIISAITTRTHLQTVRNHTDVVKTLIQHIEQQEINIMNN